MHLVIDKVVKLENVHIAYSHRTIELLARTPVEQRHLTRFRHTGETQHFLDLFLVSAVKHRGCERHPRFQVAGHFDNLVITQLRQIFWFAVGVIHLVEEFTEFFGARLTAQHFANPEPQAFGGQP